MLDQLDDLRPPAFTEHHLAEIRLRAARIRRKHRRNWATAAAVISAAAISTAAYATPGGRSTRVQVSTVTAPPGPTGVSPTSSVRTGGSGLMLTGWPPAGAGSEVIFPTADSSGFIVVNVAQHTATNVALPGHGQINGMALLGRTGGWVGYSGATAYFWPTSLTGPGRDLGHANRLFPSSAADQVWTMTQISGPTPSNPVGSETIQQVNTAGVTTAGPFQVPSNTTPIGATNGGIVLRTYDHYQPSRPNPIFGLELWTPQTGVTRQLQPPVPMGDLVAAGNVIAWTITNTSSAAGGRIDLFDIATGDLHVIEMGAGSSIPELSLRSVAPDGTRLLALGGGASSGPVGDSPPADYRDNSHVWVLDANTGTARDLGQISDPDGAAWAPNSQWIWEGLDGHLTAVATDGNATYRLPVPAPATANGTEISVR